jgi:uncharacterized cupin superfamily protein
MRARDESEPTRPPFIRNVSELPGEPDKYAGDDEVLAVGTLLSRSLGLTRLGIWHVELTPGTRTSWPHAEEKEEEFVYVLDGKPEAWIDGYVHSLVPGDCVAFPPGTGIAHTFLNNTDSTIRLLCIGERFADNRFFFPLHPKGYEGMKEEQHWADPPARERGPHDGMPDALRVKRLSHDR